MTVNIDELKEESRDIALRAKILSVEKRETKSERGEGVYYYGLLGDESGTIPYTAWAFPQTVRAGDVVEIKNCYTKEYKGKIRLYLDSKSEVIMRPGEELEVKRTYKQYKIKDLTTSDSYVLIEGKISGVRSREYEKEGTKQMIYSGFLEDETGRIRISSFGRELKDDQQLRLEGARISEYNGRLRVSINEKTKVGEANIIIPETKRHYKVSEIKSPIGGIILSGFVISFGEKSGLISRCSVCNKKIEDVRCEEHPTEPYIYDLFAYFTLDDGTNFIQCTAGRQALLPLLGMSESDLDVNNPKLTRKDTYSKIREALLSKSFVFEGDLSNSRIGMSFRVSSIRPLTREDVKAEITEIEEEFQ